MRTILLRLRDLLCLSFALSSLSCALYYYGVISASRETYGLVLIATTVVFIVSNIFMLRKCFFDIANLKMYYILNYSAYCIFMMITAGVYLWFGELPYAWLFNTLKLTSFAKTALSTVTSTMITHVVMLVVIAVAPAGMDWVLQFTEEMQEDEE